MPNPLTFDSHPSTQLFPALAPYVLMMRYRGVAIQQLDDLMCLASQSLGTQTEGTGTLPSQLACICLWEGTGTYLGLGS